MDEISRRVALKGAAALGLSPRSWLAAVGGGTVSGPWLIKRASDAEIDITDGIQRMALSASVWQEWVTLLGYPAPGYTVVSDALWNALQAIGPAIPPPPVVPPPVVPPPAPAPVPPPTMSGWPTAANTGVPAGMALVTRTDAWRSSVIPSTNETLPDGKTYRVIRGYDFRAASQYMAVDQAYVIFRQCKFSATGTISNGMSLVQLQSSSRSAIFEDCTFDGGPMHNRCLWGDPGDITVRRCFFTRFGEAAVEKNDRSGVYSMLVEDSFLDEVKGWPSGTHTDGLQMDGGKNFTARHNTINVEPWNDGVSSGASNACIGVWSTLANMVGDILIERNLLAGAGSNLYCEQRGFAMRGAVAIRDNVFDRKRYPTLKNTAAIWFGLYPGGRPSQLVWSGNAFDDGTPLTLAQAIVSNP